jgi:hypothetical protein
MAKGAKTMKKYKYETMNLTLPLGTKAKAMELARTSRRSLSNWVAVIIMEEIERKEAARRKHYEAADSGKQLETM